MISSKYIYYRNFVLEKYKEGFCDIVGFGRCLSTSVSRHHCTIRPFFVIHTCVGNEGLNGNVLAIYCSNTI